MLIQTENKWQRELLKECNISYIMFRFKSSVIRQKGESQNGCFKKTKHAKFPKNEHFLPPDPHKYTNTYQGVRNVRFTENLACFVSLKHPFRDSPFCIITDVIKQTFWNHSYCYFFFIAMQFQKGSLTEPYNIAIALKHVEKETLSDCLKYRILKNNFKPDGDFTFPKNLSSRMQPVV